ncbi:uncharacterized protein [Nicotiana tomentosiformis]|uniref:uncharacterized protein n=1 Tax=Nicotiana tomentosiformis TaxID=4098 RepID=UPI00388C8AE3
MAFASNLNEKSSDDTRRMKESLREFPATTWNDMYNKYSTKLWIEEDTIVQPRADERAVSRQSKSEKRTEKNKYEPCMGPTGRDSRSKQENRRFDSRPRQKDTSSSSRFRKEWYGRGNDSNTHAKIGDYNLNVSTSKLVTILRGMGDKGEVEHLLKQGYLTDLFSEKARQSYMKNRQEPPKPPSPKRTVNVIIGGDEVNGVTYTAAKKTSKVTVTHGKRVRQVLDRYSITFDDEDADDLMIPHNDVLVISLLVHDTNVKLVLIDPGSSVNIIFLRVVNEMQANDKVIQKARSLSGFDNSNVITEGEVMLTRFAEGVVKDTKFQVIDVDMEYNIILGRPWIHDIDVVPSTLHQVIKLPSQWGIRQICGDQQASRSVNSVVITSTVTNDADAK